MSQTQRESGKSSPSPPAGQATTRDTQPVGETNLTTKHRYTLEELLSQCDGQAPISAGIVAWEAARPVGREIL